MIVELQIVNYASEHIAQVAAIEAASYRDPWSEAGFRDLLMLSDTSWVVTNDDEVLAYLITQWVLDEIHILNIAVKNDSRSQGIGSRLLTMLLDTASQRGMRDVFLEVRLSNVVAQRLYGRFGFLTLATRKNYYPEGEDALIMYCHVEETRALATAPTLNGEENYGH